MIIEKSNRCIAASFAMVVGCTLEEMIEKLGHDGREIVLPELSPPLCFRAHNLQEFHDALYPLKLIHIEEKPRSIHGMQIWDDWKKLPRDRFETWLGRGDGVILGKKGNVGHAVAWLDGLVYDPAGKIYPLRELDLTERHFILCTK